MKSILSIEELDYLIEHKSIYYVDCKCIGVIDGDSIIVDQVTIPFINNGCIQSPRIRLSNINCKELKNKDSSAQIAKDLVTELLLDKEIILEINAENSLDPFSRILAVVYIKNTGINLCQYLLDNGLAEVYDK